jgi:hypothetical protein
MNDTHTPVSASDPPGRRPLHWRLLRGLVIGLAVLGTLIALFYAVENWRGKRAWLNFKQDWEAKGERFDLEALIPKPVADDQNFAKTPFLAPLLDYQYNTQKQAHWRDTNALARAQSVGIFKGESARRKSPRLGGPERGELTDLRAWQEFFRDNTNYPSSPGPREPALDVLVALSGFAPALEELQAASQRPYSVFPVHYDEGYAALLPYLAIVRSLGPALHLRAIAHLEVQQTEAALKDVKLGCRLAESVKVEPLLISQLVRIAVLHITMAAVWEGLAQHQWTGPQLEDLQKYLASIRVLDDYPRAIRGERALGNQFLDDVRSGKIADPGAFTGSSPDWMELLKFAPRGWLYQNQLLINRLHQERTLPLVDPEKHRVYPELAQRGDDHPELKTTTPFNVFARLLFPALAKTSQKFARGQTIIDQALAACALERFRLANSRYPENLDALVPRYLERVPADVIDGQPLKYRRSDGGHFVLYSVGWNQTDEGGTVVFGKSKNIRTEEGDWVWQYPPGRRESDFE